jgi:protoporphyrinogen/coproporphyrinogen III oxidase
MPKILIVGGGISGLSAAYYLNKSGVRPTLVEKAPQLGGVIRTSVQQGCVLEAGPDSFMAAKPWAMDLIREVGLADQVIGSNDHLRVTYILKKGKLVPLPDGLMMMVPTKIMPLVGTRLLSWGTKIRMGLELLRRPPKAPLADRSVYDFLLDHYGQESIDYLAEPLLAGVYGGDPREMSVNSVLARFVEIEAKYGSLTRGVLAAPRPKGSGSGSLFRSLKNGIGQLVDALQGTADVVHGAVESLEPNGPGFRARVNGDWIAADHVVLATPAGDAARLLQHWNGELAALLQAIPYTSSVTLSLGYRKDTFDHPLKGFGFLVPKRERKLMAACTWVGNKFTNRVPDDMVLLRCFMGGDALKESDETLVAAAQRELRSIMGMQAVPVFHSIARWPNSMAQYTVGHEKRQQQVESIVKGIPGLHLAGNGYRGIGLPDCIRAGKEAATRITS